MTEDERAQGLETLDRLQREVIESEVRPLRQHFLKPGLRETSFQMGVDPTSHLIHELGREAWSGRFLQHDFCQFVAWLVKQVLFLQHSYDAMRSRKTIFQELSLAARRFILLYISDPRYIHESFRRELLKSDVLPGNSLYQAEPNFEPAGTEAIKTCLRWVNRIENGLLDYHARDLQAYDLDAVASPDTCPYFNDDDLILAHPRKRIEIELDEHKRIFSGPFSRALQASSAFTRLNACHSFIEPVSYSLSLVVAKHRHNRSITKLDAADLRFLLYALMEVMHGIPALHCSELLLKNEDSRLGCISTDEITLKLAGGKYPAALDAWKPASLTLPLANECSWVLQELIGRFPNAKSLGDFRFGSENRADSYRSRLQKVTRSVMPNYRGAARSLGKAWLKVALLDLDIPASVLGLLRANPLPGARGPAAYVGITRADLVVSLALIQDRIRRKAARFTL